MNYISQIKAFHELVQDKSLSTGQIALWYALMYINNRCAWAEWFTVSARSLELNTGLSRQAIIKNRNVLKQLGLIDFKPNGVKATSYKIEDVANSLQSGCQDSLQDSLQPSCQNSSTLNKPNVNQTKPNNKKKVTNVTLEKNPLKDYANENRESAASLHKGSKPQQEQSFLNCLEMLNSSDLLAEEKAKLGEWLQHKRERKDKYTQTGFKALLTEYRNNVKAFGREPVFRAIDQSMAGGYAGIVWDKAQKDGRKQGIYPTTGGEISPELQELETAIIYGRHKV